MLNYTVVMVTLVVSLAPLSMHYEAMILIMINSLLHILQFGINESIE